MRAEARLRAVFALAAVLLGGCYASNVVAVKDRMVRDDLGELAWRPATPADLDGLFASVAITGDAALVLRRIDYWFGEGGRYAAAALQDEGGDGPSFQVASGRWSLTEQGLVLDGQEPAECTVANDHLRLVTAAGAIVLRREALQ